MGADATLAFFGSSRPTTVQGAMALADALDQRGRSDEARLLIQRMVADPVLRRGDPEPHPDPLGLRPDPARPRRAHEHAAQRPARPGHARHAEPGLARASRDRQRRHDPAQRLFRRQRRRQPVAVPGDGPRRGAGTRPHPARRQPPDRRLRPPAPPCRPRRSTPTGRRRCGTSVATISSTRSNAASGAPPMIPWPATASPRATARLTPSSSPAGSP